MTWLDEERRAAEREQYTRPHPTGCQCPECARDEAYAGDER